MKNVKNLFLKNGICIVFFILPFSFFLNAQDSLRPNKIRNIQIKGFIKDLQSVYFTDNTESLITGNYIHNRINLRWNISDNFHARIEARNRIYYGEQVKSTDQFGKYIGDDKGYFKLSKNIIDDTSLVFNASLDRLLINWTKKKWDITVGRQRINWGINLVWNPNDIFNTFNYFDFDYEERPGGEALRIQYYTTAISSFEIAYRPSKKIEQQVAALMYKTNFKKYDLQEFVGIYLEDVVLGTGWAGNIKQLGFKGEASYFHSYKKDTDTSSALVSSVSIDRSFKKGYFVTLSYLYNSKGENNLYGGNDFTSQTLSAKNLMPFRNTLFIMASKEINPLVNASLSAMYSTAKKTLIVLPSVNISMSDNWDMSLVAQLFFADVYGVYRTLGNSVYLRIRWSY